MGDSPGIRYQLHGIEYTANSYHAMVPAMWEEDLSKLVTLFTCIYTCFDSPLFFLCVISNFYILLKLLVMNILENSLNFFEYLSNIVCSKTVATIIDVLHPAEADKHFLAAEEGLMKPCELIPRVGNGLADWVPPVTVILLFSLKTILHNYKNCKNLSVFFCFFFLY